MAMLSFNFGRLNNCKKFLLVSGRIYKCLGKKQKQLIITTPSVWQGLSGERFWLNEEV